MARKAVIGLSDGVDSAVAAWLLLRQGYEVHALYLDIAGEKEKQDAAASARFLGIPLSVCDIRGTLEREVCAPFAEAYFHGLTPNPCIGCNPKVKFPALLRLADELGAEYIATGHYVRTDGENLYMGEQDHDQSYMLARLTGEQVRRLLLPLGEYRKAEVRALAAQIGLSAADKPDSLENCFIPKGMPYAEWLESRGRVPAPGPVYCGGVEIGRHEGIHRYTVGQRWPQLYRERRLYISAIDAEHNALHVVLWEDTFTDRVRITDLSFIHPIPEKTIRASVRVRHTRWETPGCTVTFTADGAEIRTDTPLRAPAPGQAAALYDGTRLLGGGYIVSECS